MKPTEHKKFIKLASKSRKGDVNASYELYSSYSSGKFLEQDDAKANEYLQLAIKQFSHQRIELSQLSILNFRIIDRLNLDMTSSHVQVLVGNNGAGKTTVLDAISNSLSWLIQRIVHRGGRAKDIEKTDITLGNADGYSSIITKIKLNKNYSTTLELCEVEDGSIVNKKSFYTDFTKLGHLYKLACEYDEHFELPLLAYYGVMRATDINSKDVAEYDETSVVDISNRFDGYNNALSGKADFKGFFRWYKRLDDLVKHETTKAHQTDPTILSSLEKLAQTDENSRKLLNELISNLKESKKNEENSVARERQKIINNTISLFMEDFKNLNVELKPTLHLSVEKLNKKINVLQLSQGEKSLLALVLDICRRMMVLNPLSENPLLTAGIILIDEVDLHLHPEWQRNVLKKLTDVFPNCQFIVSTHSPQIISEVKHDQLFILGKDDNGNFNCSSPEQSYGLTSNQVLNEIMKTGSHKLDRSPEVQEKIDNIFRLIADGKLEIAKDQITEMEIELNGEIPEFVSAKFDIELQGWDEE
ncbi:TPA: AAA family ATPase [Raoultella planticola]|uniref:AAA family ATPase n=1 Tax=Raoultella planticola TaxID=575 RepID=UPI001A28CA96|nr:AAA family ATPase [Raoultella planticola]